MQNTTEQSGRLKTFWLPVLLGFSVGANLILWMGSNNAPQVAHGETGSGRNGFIMTAFVMQGKGQAEGLAIFDTNTKKLWTGYETGNGFSVNSVRDLNYDFVPQEYSQKGKQKPSVKAMKEAGRK